MGKARALLVVLLLSFGSAGLLPGQGNSSGPDALRQEIDRRAVEILPKVISWRRDFHQNPELSNREFRTAKIVAQHLQQLGLEVKTGIAHTGVVGLMRGGRPGSTVALRSDMDGLPVTEEVDLPFSSKARGTYNGREVGVMHACGHDLHMAMLMGAAEILSGMKERIPGNVKFVFQPAEEGAPEGENGGAALMVQEGTLENPKAAAIFGLHVFYNYPVGQIATRSAGIMAGSDTLRIVIRGRQTHGALPWMGIDPIVVASQVVMGLQTILSRQSELTKAPAVVTIGRINGGVRSNIIPDTAEMEGTIRTFDPRMQEEIHKRVRRTAEMIAQSAGATAEVTIIRGNPVTYNDPQLSERMNGTLKRVAGNNWAVADWTTTAEDFAWYQKETPGLFFFLGVTPRNMDPARVAANHSPRFFADEGALIVGVRALAHLATDYLLQQPSR